MEFEDSLGHTVKIKARCITDLEPHPTDEMIFYISYDTYGFLGRKNRDIFVVDKDRRNKVMTYIKRFLTAAHKDEIKKESTYPDCLVERNILTDLKSLFIG